MTLPVELPDPLRYRVDEFGLPESVKLALYDYIHARVSELHQSEETRTKSFTTCITDNEAGDNYAFQVTVAAKIVGPVFLLTDAKIHCSVVDVEG